MSDRISRGEIISLITGVPAVVAATAAAASAEANNGGPNDANKPARAYGYVGHPGPGGKKCSNCGLFAPPNHCDVVPGIVSPSGYCKLYSKKR